MAITHYVLDGGAETTGTVVTASDGGRHTLEFWSVDIAGNAETPHHDRELHDHRHDRSHDHLGRPGDLHRLGDDHPHRHRQRRRLRRRVHPLHPRRRHGGHGHGRHCVDARQPHPRVLVGRRRRQRRDAAHRRRASPIDRLDRTARPTSDASRPTTDSATDHPDRHRQRRRLGRRVDLLRPRRRRGDHGHGRDRVDARQPHARVLVGRRRRQRRDAAQDGELHDHRHDRSRPPPPTPWRPTPTRRRSPSPPPTTRAARGSRAPTTCSTAERRPPARSSLRPRAGSHTLEFWSVDVAGNVETPHQTASFTVIDTIAPTTTSDAQATYTDSATDHPDRHRQRRRLGRRVHPLHPRRRRRGHGTVVTVSTSAATPWSSGRSTSPATPRRRTRRRASRSRHDITAPTTTSDAADLHRHRHDHARRRPTTRAARASRPPTTSSTAAPRPPARS